MSLRKTKGVEWPSRGKQNRKEREGKRVPYRDSRRPCPSIYHSHIIGPAQIFQSSREKKDRSFIFPFSLRPSPVPFRSVSFRSADAAASASPSLLDSSSRPSSPLVAALFSHDARNSIQSSQRDLCRTLRSFVYRRFKAAVRGQPARHVFLAVSLSTLFPRRPETRTPPRRRSQKANRMRSATDHSVHNPLCLRVHTLARSRRGRNAFAIRDTVVGCLGCRGKFQSIGESDHRAFARGDWSSNVTRFPASFARQSRAAAAR